MTEDETEFRETFNHLTGHAPFPWQEELYQRFLRGEIPEVCDLPTGLGKTSIIAIWLIALAKETANVPRRLVYVVNRRTVVDQTTSEVEQIRDNLKEKPELATLRNRLGKLAISTLRGQFADNQEWSADPSRPAVICGTVDMIGSRLLFSGYRIGFKSRPLHAGFLGQDALLVHDEAHLEPAFQELIESIQCEQTCREKSIDLPWPKLRVMQLTATTRIGEKLTEKLDKANGQKPFGLTEKEKNPPDDIPDPPTEPVHHVWRRLTAKKQIVLHKAGDGKDAVTKAVAKLAEYHKDANANVLVFLRTLNDVEVVAKELEKTARSVILLTGTMRGKERDTLVEQPEFKRFLRDGSTGETVYLVCTSAGEIGVNLSADHMVCDLSTFDSMAQRLGRVNRFGDRDDTRIDVVYPAPESLDDKHSLTPARKATLVLLEDLNGNASPRALGDLMRSLNNEQREAAFTPPPTILPATDILFDAWAMTSIRQPMPGRPPVGPYLHGIAEWEPPRTSVAWRNEVKYITDELIKREGEGFPQELLADYPLKPHELLSDTTERVYKQLQDLIAKPKANIKREKRQRALERAGKNAAANIWLIDDRGEIAVTTLGDLLSDEKKRVTEQLAGSTLLLPPEVGGIAGGILDGTSEWADDVSEITEGPNQRIRILRVDSDDKAAATRAGNMRRVRTIELSDNDDDDEPRKWEWYASFPLEGGRTAKKPVTWQTHVDDVVNNAKRIVSALSLPPEIADAVIVAAEMHDHGKRRERFQTTLGNRWYPDVLLAKSGKRGARLPETFRHEFASLLDSGADDRFKQLDDEMQDLVLHLIAAHHGRARPHFSRHEAFDPERPSGDAEALAIETPRRFARLQRKYGRWGLAYLESLLRAADWDASANPSAYMDEPEDEK